MDKTIRYAGIALAVIAVVIALVMVVPGLNPLVPATPGAAGEKGPVTVYFFYGEECPHCHEVRPFIESLRAKYPDVQFYLLETWHNESNHRLSQSMNRALGQKEEPGVPEVIVGETVLIGSVDIPAKLEQVIIEKKKIVREVPTTAVLSAGPEVTAASPTVDATYFYGDTCSHCAKVKPLLDTLEARYPDLNLTRLEVYNNAENRDQLAVFSQQYGVANPGVPIIFIGDSVLLGDIEITDRFENEIHIRQQYLASCNTTSPAPVVTPAEPGCTPPAPQLSLPLVVGAALVDSTNPCGLSVLVFLLITMAAAGGRRRILFVGGAYIAAMFLFHLLVGIGLFSLFALSGLAKLFSVLGGALALLLGLITLVDVLRNRETFFLSIPESKKGMLGDIARKASLPAAFVLGILAGILGFTCTGGIYISILGLMGKEMTVMTGLPWLILYNLVYVLPLVVITLLVAYGLSPERADKLRGEYKREVRLLIGLVLVALGSVILLGWVG